MRSGPNGWTLLAIDELSDFDESALAAVLDRPPIENVAVLSTKPGGLRFFEDAKETSETYRHLSLLNNDGILCPQRKSHMLEYLEKAAAPKAVKPPVTQPRYSQGMLNLKRRNALEVIKREIHKLDPVAQAVLRDIEELLL